MTKNDHNRVDQTQVLNVALTVVFIIIVTLFCKASDITLILPLFLFFLGLHLVFCHKGNIRLFLQLGLLLAIILITSQVFVVYWGLSPFLVPSAGIAMLTMLLFNSRQLAFIMSLASGVLIATSAQQDFGFMLTLFLGGLAGAYSVRDARTRGQLIASGFFVSVIHAVCLILLNPSVGLLVENDYLTQKFYPLVANGFLSAFLVAATLKVFESLFGVLTNFSLLELADFNQPLLKKMILEAPGTYHHSLVVSNLGEAAADAIQANSLLTRVGAYYHDIGKMVKPEYFTENQMLGSGNIHDKIEPTMSRLVILNHVKEGIEMAKRYKLNPKIAQFIPEHHGTSLIYYFYHKSVEASGEENMPNEEEFRYPGPKPQTRETAISLLADSVEGATRALDDPNPQNIEETVQKIVNNKFIDGQLDECPLTLNEINIIAKTFTRILTAMYHGRVKYPEQKNASHSQRPPKEAQTESGPDQEHRENGSSS